MALTATHDVSCPRWFRLPVELSRAVFKQTKPIDPPEYITTLLLLQSLQIVPMPNISFDIFFDQDFINISATRGQTAPKAKPAWKVRSAPKLPPKDPAAPKPGSVRPPQRPKINEGRGQVGKPAPKYESGKVTEIDDAASQGSEKPRRKPAKLGPRKSAAEPPKAE